MQRFEYKVVPAPKKGEKAKGAKTVAERFALALGTVMNDMGRDGWDYLRADTLPCEERVGLTGSKTAFQNMLVFRRMLDAHEIADETPLPVFPAPPVAPPVPHAPRIVMSRPDSAAGDFSPSTDILLRALRKDQAGE